MQRLLKYFSEGVVSRSLGDSIGIEVETSFVDCVSGRPITVEQSQKLLETSVTRLSWEVTQRKSQLITEISDRQGNKLLYELGRQNIEFAGAPGSSNVVVNSAQEMLMSLVGVGASIGVKPHLGPILKTDESLLIIPDERDAVWLELDGRPALELLARTSAVQFTISVPVSKAIECLNRLGKKIGSFLKDYPQEEYWRRYIKESKANYHPMRYGGPLFFDSIEDYCHRLIRHDVVVGPKLVPYDQVENLDIPLYLRSIWWYFRLRRYGDTLCIEVRPLPRRINIKLKDQFDFVMNILSKV